ncbi:unnamed protein product, partial [Ectocarpus sp. 8 AP-2014]
AAAAAAAAGGLGLSRISEGGGGDISRSTERIRGGSSADGRKDQAASDNMSSSLMFDDNDSSDGEGLDGYSVSRAGWLRPRTPAGATAGRGAGAGAGAGAGDSSRQSLGSTWGGCSTIKRRPGDDDSGAGWSSVRHRGVVSAGLGHHHQDVEGERATRGVGGAERSSSGGGGRGGSGADGFATEGSMHPGAGVGGSRWSNGRKSSSSGGGGGGGGPFAVGEASAARPVAAAIGCDGVTPLPAGRGGGPREAGAAARRGSSNSSSGSEGSAGRGVRGGSAVGEGLSGGRADYHSFCFSSSSSSIATTATPHSSSLSASSPFPNLLDGGDDSTSSSLS